MANGQEVVMRVGTVATFMEIILEGFLAMEASLTGTGIMLDLWKFYDRFGYETGDTATRY